MEHMMEQLRRELGVEIRDLLRAFIRLIDAITEELQDGR